MVRIRQKIAEKDMWVDGEFMSETAMVKDGLPEYLCPTLLEYSFSMPVSDNPSVV